MTKELFAETYFWLLGKKGLLPDSYTKKEMIEEGFELFNHLKTDENRVFYLRKTWSEYCKIVLFEISNNLFLNEEQRKKILLKAERELNCFIKKREL